MLVITVKEDPTIGGRAVQPEEITALAGAHRTGPEVISLRESAGGVAAVSAVLRARRLCGGLGIPLAVAAPSVAARHLLEANADTTTSVVVHAGVGTAVAASAFTTAA
ncbi:hypothetical protein [Streptomyces cinereospinus]|uniref:Uncharacterized protein n=1 Tax=Streptomyces cinereospinus TaxID=285561 RepID=A0ABV5MWS8_9ACTN